MKKRTLSLMLACCLALSTLLASCGKTGEVVGETSDSTGSGAQTSGTDENAPQPGPQALPVTDKDVTITWFMDFFNTQCNNQGEVAGYSELEKRAGVKINWIHPSAGAGAEEFNLMVVSGDYPDVITWNWKNVKGGPGKYIKDGVIIDITDMANKYVPNYTSSMRDKKQIYLDDGSMYGFCLSNSDPMLAAWKGFLVREDWMEKVGAGVPETIADWHTMLTAFKEKDPNGNGKQDEIPLVTPRENTFASFATAWGVKNTYCTDPSTKKIVFGPIQPAYKEFLAEMAKWYQEGLIDKEYVAVDGQTAQSKLMQNTAGAALDFTSGINNYKVGLQSVGVEGNFIGVLPPALEKGGKHYTENNGFLEEVGSNVTAISTACKNVDVVGKLINYMLSEEGNTLLCWGVEGESYEIVDGKKQFTDLVMKDPSVSPYEKVTRYAYPNWPFNTPVDIDAYSQIEYVLPAQKEASSLWATADYDLLTPPLTYTESESARLSEINSDVETYVSEMTSKFIMGLESLDNFDKFVSTINSMQIEEAVQIQNTALDRYNAR